MTTYEREVQNLTTPSFYGIRSIAYKQLQANFSREENEAMYYELKRGTSVIGRKELLWCYLYAFGKKHQAKIHAALSRIKNLTEIVCSEYSIIDWGCGQGLATICMFDYLHKQDVTNTVKKIVLIEPSELALKNAGLHTSIYGTREILSVNKFLDDVTAEDIKTDTSVTIHLFSNILDVEGFSLKQLAQTIGASASGEHYFICVSPIYSNDHRIEAFYNYFAESDAIAYIEESRNEIAVLANEQHDSTAEENFTMKLLIFKYVSGKSYVIQIEYYPPVQFFAGAELDCIRKKRRSFSKENAVRWSNMMAFEVAAPFDLGASVYDDVHPIVAVLNNIVTRGLPTRTSPYIEDVFSCFGNSLIHDELGGVEYTNVLSDNEQVRMAQYYSPIGIARIQKTVLEALMTGVLSIEQESWDVLVRERDVPCAAMAFIDLKNMFSHIASLSRNYQAMKLPEVRLTIICSDEWVDSPLHLGMQAKATINESIRSTTYDIVVDVTVLSNTDGGIQPFSEFKCMNNCYFTIRSAEKIRSKRYIYTSDTIDYLPLGIKNRFGDFEESENMKEHLAYFLKLLFRKEAFRPGQIPILDRALQNKNVIGLLPTGGGKSLTYQFAAMMQPGVTIVIDPLRSLMKDQYDGLLNMGIDTCSFINSTLDAKERSSREKQMESSELQFVYSLQALFESASNVTKALENNTQQIIADINNRIEMLNIQASDIDRYAQQGVSKISEQSALAQSKLEDELGNLVQKLTGTISTSTNQSLEAVENELAGYHVLVHEAARKFTDSTSDANTKQEGYIIEIGKLVACIQERQYALDSKIEELKHLDIVHLFVEISVIRRIESENATATKKWRVIELRAFGGCIVLGIAILIRLLVM